MSCISHKSSELLVRATLSLLNHGVGNAAHKKLLVCPVSVGVTMEEGKCDGYLGPVASSRARVALKLLKTAKFTFCVGYSIYFQSLLVEY